MAKTPGAGLAASKRREKALRAFLLRALNEGMQMPPSAASRLVAGIVAQADAAPMIARRKNGATRKRCPRCGVNKPAAMFGRDNRAWNFLRSHCRACEQAAQRMRLKRAEAARMDAHLKTFADAQGSPSHPHPATPLPDNPNNPPHAQPRQASTHTHTTTQPHPTHTGHHAP